MRIRKLAGTRGRITTTITRAIATAAAGAVLVTTALTGLPSAAAEVVAPADEAEGLPETVSADPLPTVQVDGVVWDQLVVGDVVYVVGDFDNARPAGAAPGVDEVPRGNMLAYDLNTGELIENFAPMFNAQTHDVAVSEDGSRLYVVGNFTNVSGHGRYRIAQLDARNGNVTGFSAGTNAYATAVAVNGSTVYVGGVFTNVNGTRRDRIVALDSTTGAVRSAFNVSIGNYQVRDIAVAPDGESIIAAGSFTLVNNSTRYGYGMTRLDAVTGSPSYLPVNSEVRNAGTATGIETISSDGENFYGSAWLQSTSRGNSEGSFSASWETGELNWLEDCHGDTYATFPHQGVVYIASHKHYCGNSGGFPQTLPWTYYHATAVADGVYGTNRRDPYGYPDHPGTPRPEFLEWYPTMAPGAFTGQDQAAWTVTGSEDYVLFAGEFPSVNGTPQQGLVRFTTRAHAPNEVSASNQGANWPLTAANTRNNTVDLSWQGNADRDDATLTYSVYRDTRDSEPINTQTVTAPFWAQPRLSVADSDLESGETHRYLVVVSDPWGAQTRTDWRMVTAAGPEYFSWQRARLPWAWMTLSQQDEQISVDASAAGTPVGRITDYSWDFGDGTSGSGLTATHTYDAPGDYTVALEVSNSYGFTAHMVKSVTVEDSAAPVATFTSATDGLTVRLDGADSQAPAGELVSYSWDLGDGTTGTGANLDHTYAEPGTYQVTLRVVDDRGVEATLTREIVVEESVVIVRDDFERTVETGWGEAALGGAWTTHGRSTQYAVADGAGLLRVEQAGWNPRAMLSGVEVADASLLTTLSLEEIADGSGAQAVLSQRADSWTSAYRAKVHLRADGSVRLSLTRLDGGESTLVTAATDLQVAAEDELSVRFEAVGTAPTQLRARIWAAGTEEPTDWDVEASDGTEALQDPGGVGVAAFAFSNVTNAPVTLRVHDLEVLPPL